MSGLDVEALLETAANEEAQKQRNRRRSDHTHDRRSDSRRDRSRDRSSRINSEDEDTVMKSPSDRGHEYHGRVKVKDEDNGRNKIKDEDTEMKILGGATAGILGETPEQRRRLSGQDRSDGDRARGDRNGGDYYRGGGRARPRSRSPDRDRTHGRDRRDRDNDRDRRDRYRERDRERDPARERDRRPLPEPRRKSRSPRRDRPAEPQLTDDERDRRTVFVQQLAARLRTRDLIAFFEKVGPVKEAQIVKDRVSMRSKGVGYVEFKDEESVQGAIQLTGHKLLGIPIIAQLTEAEKNRQARTTDNAGHNSANSGVPFHRLYVGNIHFSITEEDLTNVFEPFGELEFTQLQKDETGRSRGYGFVQFHDPGQAREALEKMNGFELAARPIRVGLGNDKFTPESTATLLQRFQGKNHEFQGSAFSGHGGRGAQAGGSGGSYGRSNENAEKGAGGASALDDTDVAGVNFNNYSRDALMRKLARTDEPSDKNGTTQKPAAKQTQKQLPIDVSTASRCVVLKNMFNPAAEEGADWAKELEEDVRAECEEKYGHVVHIAVDPNSQGDIYVKFDRVQGGENAVKGLNGRYFGGQMISVQPMVDAVYGSLFQRAKAL